jgi:hypothetical protein
MKSSARRLLEDYHIKVSVLFRGTESSSSFAACVDLMDCYGISRMDRGSIVKSDRSLQCISIEHDACETRASAPSIHMYTLHPIRCTGQRKPSIYRLRGGMRLCLPERMQHYHTRNPWSVCALSLQQSQLMSIGKRLENMMCLLPAPMTAVQPEHQYALRLHCIESCLCVQYTARR